MCNGICELVVEGILGRYLNVLRNKTLEGGEDPNR